MVKCPLHEDEKCPWCGGQQSNIDQNNDQRQRMERNINYNVRFGQSAEGTDIRPEDISKQVKKIKDAKNKKH